MPEEGLCVPEEELGKSSTDRHPGCARSDNRASVHLRALIVTIVPLQADANDPSTLNWWPKRTPSSPEFTTRFCRLTDTDRYVETTYRGKQQFAAFPAVQVDAVAALVREVCDKFSIPRELPVQGRRFECDVPTFASYKGVCSHANFRRDKWDIGPAFPWDRLGL